MIIKTLNTNESRIEMNKWLEEPAFLPDLEPDYLVLRTLIDSIHEKVVELQIRHNKKKDLYFYDWSFGLELFIALDKLDFFSMRVATNDGFWRYLSVKVAPHVVGNRWGNHNESHFWSKSSRIWFRSLWWYIFLSWQGSEEDTAYLLESACFTTDTILNLVERTGRRGTYIQVYRLIMFYISKYSQTSKIKKSSSDYSQLFRNVMKLNTAKTMVIEPSLFLGGEKEYVKSLFQELGVKIL